MPLRIVLRDLNEACWLTFENPVEVVQVRDYSDVASAMRSIEQRVLDGDLWAVGFVSYEAAPGFDSACVTLAPGTLPLLIFGLFQSPEKSAVLDQHSPVRNAPADWHLDTPQHSYMRNVERIREQIALGNTYQVNYTIRGKAVATADSWQLFKAVADDAPLAAYIEDDDYAIVSASPELFFRLDGDELVSRPMKGTAARGLSAAEDVRRRRQLSESAKDRAENIMIADMLRNDMGRIAEPGSVVAESLFDIEKYPTVWQATSTIKAVTRQPVSDIFAALFPCASITGAPKIASMKLIAKLEQSPRGIYTGAIGYIAPERHAQFSVAIRTAHIDRASGNAEYGVGSGIVWDSRPVAEYAECLTKGRILRQHRPSGEFQLIETLLWSREGGYFLLDRHLARLSASADYFDFRIDTASIMGALHRLTEKLHNEQHRVRLLLDKSGHLHLSETALCLPQRSSPARVRLAASPVDSENVFLYHKTTHREVYEQAIAGLGECDDALLWNEDGYLTESTIANVAVRINDRLYTPPLRCGLLPGVLRESLLEAGHLHERAIKVTELQKTEEIVLLNSVRRQYRAELLQ